MTDAEKQARLDELIQRRAEIIDGKNPKSTEFDGQKTEFFKPDLDLINSEIQRLECDLGITAPTRRRSGIGVFF